MTRLVYLTPHEIDAGRIVSIRDEATDDAQCRVDLDDGTARFCKCSRAEAVRVVNAERDRASTLWPREQVHVFGPAGTRIAVDDKG